MVLLQNGDGKLDKMASVLLWVGKSGRKRKPIELPIIGQRARRENRRDCKDSLRQVWRKHTAQAAGTIVGDCTITVFVS